MTTTTCTYLKCDGASFQSTDPGELGAWMDQHVIEAPHVSDWPVTFRLDHPAYPHAPGVAYRAAVATEAPVQQNRSE